MNTTRVTLLALALVFALGAVWLAPLHWWPPSMRDQLLVWLGPPPFEAPPPTMPAVEVEPEPACTELNPDWRDGQTIDGVEIEPSRTCNPDNPFDVAAFVKGTNNIAPMALMNTHLAPDAVEKSDDRDGDGDPDVIHIRVEVAELNGFSPDVDQPVPDYQIAPGIRPGFWVFAPKTRGMATENAETLVAHRLLRAPSPVIRIEQGDEVKITLENSHIMPHTIHFHGVDHPFLDAQGEGNDGVPHASEMPVMPGDARTYDLRPRHAGTMFYHCHVQPAVHILMGLQGMFVVEENRPNNWLQTFNIGAGAVRVRSAASREAYDREYDLHYQDLDRELHEIIQTSNDPRVIAEQAHRRYDVTERTADYFLLNGRSFPYTIRESTIVAKPDERIRLRVLNGGAEGVALHTHGHKTKITHYDGVEADPAAQLRRDVVWIAPAQRVDLLLETENDGLRSYGEGVWLLHDHREMAVTTDGMGPGGDVSAIVYESFLGEDGWPKVQGVDWAPLFTPEYYRREVPVWAAYDPLGILGDVPPEQAVRIKTVLFALDVGLLLAVLVLLFRPRRKESA